MRVIHAMGWLTVFLLATGQARAGVTIGFDESGSGFSQVDNGAKNPLTSGMGVDPFSNKTTLFYNLPNGTNPTEGDVVVNEPGLPILRSDIFRFVNNRVYVFSDLESNEPPNGADQFDLKGFPVEVNYTSMTEVGPEAGPNGIVYTPGGPPPLGGDADPGYSVAAATTYNFLSDPAPIPEPSSMVLVLSGLAVGLIGRQRRMEQGAKRDRSGDGS